MQGTKKRIHASDLQKEKEERERRAKNQEQKAASSSGTDVPGSQKKRTKTKAVRIRKGVRIMGIKVVDSDSKKKVMKLLKAEAAAKMDTEGGGGARRGRRGMILAPSSQTLKGAISKPAGRKVAKIKPAPEGGIAPMLE